MKQLKRLFIQTSLLAVAFVCNAQIEYVNVFIGTNGMGHTFPGACYPYGSIQLSPDTDTIPHNVNGKYQKDVYNYCAGYQYKDKSIVGFSHTHFSGTGHSDLGDILIMPYTGNTFLNPGTADNPDNGYRQRADKTSEKANPGYYSIRLSDSDILCELTATKHCGVHRYTFPKGAKQKIIIDLNHGIYNYEGKTLWAQCNVDNKEYISGYRITNGWSRTNYTYFSIHFSKKIKEYGCKDFGEKKYNGFWGKFNTEKNFPEMGGRELVTWFEFEDDGNEELEIVVSLSATSTLGAYKNMAEDDCNIIGKRDKGIFDLVRKQTEEEWNRRLSIVEAQGSDDAKAMLYTSLYHTLINPSLYQDADGKYRGIDHNIYYNKSQRTNYTVFSLWDTYRAFHPLLSLLDSTLTKDIMFSFLKHWEVSPHKMLPVWSHMGGENWCMIGYHGVSVLADATNKGYSIEECSRERFLLAMEHSANCDYYLGTDAYKKYGYVPVDKQYCGTSITLENAYEDWTIYRTLSIMKKDKDLEEYYKGRAMSYKEVFDKNGFAHARYSNGEWKEPYSLLSTSEIGLVEGNAWNYSFYVPHNVNGLMNLMGGEKNFVKRLDTLFTMYIPDEFFAETEDVTREGMLGGYVQGNEPSHHIPYLYMWTTQPWKTQYWMREIMNKMYRNDIDGLCGNDDCGQMSAWYVFSAMGFYPVCPGSNEYVFGAPYLPYLKVKLANGVSLEIKATKVSDKNRYIQKILWNGKEYDKAFITHEMLMQGGTLEFVMNSKPNKKLFQTKESKPYSLSK